LPIGRIYCTAIRRCNGILSAPSTPACALPGASMRRIFSKQGFRLEIVTATLRFESPNNPLFKNLSQKQEIFSVY
jgi:hypothetical protein